jgi:hypothetical protein
MKAHILAEYLENFTKQEEDYSEELHLQAAALLRHWERPTNTVLVPVEELKKMQIQLQEMKILLTQGAGL